MFQVSETFHIGELIVALFLAYCFAAAGDLLTNRRANSLLAWNQSLCVGLSAATAFLFPLSLVLPGHALFTVAATLIAAGVWRAKGAFQQNWATCWRRIGPSFKQTDRLSWLLLALLAFFCLQFIIQNALRAPDSDGYQIWSTKAFVLYHRGAMTTDLLIPGEYDRVNAYPFMVPLYQALVGLLRGQFGFEGLKQVFAFFWVSMLVSIYYATRAIAPRRIALAASVLLASIPSLATRRSVEGFADIPEACFVAAVAAAFFQIDFRPPSSFRDPLPWLCMGLLLVKSEGTVLLIILCIVISFSWLLRSSVFENCRSCWRPISLCLSGILLRLWMIQWVGGHDPDHASPLAKASWVRVGDRIFEVPLLCLAKLIEPSEWGLLWPMLFLAIPIVLLKGKSRERSAAVATGLALISYTATFYFTNWIPSQHINVAYDRLLAQLAPAAVLIIVAAYSRSRVAATGSTSHDVKQNRIVIADVQTQYRSGRSGTSM